VEIKKKEAAVVAPALGKLLNQMEKAIGTKVYEIQSDHGSEFKAQTLRLMKARKIKWTGVRLGARIEQMNAYFQRSLYSLIRQGRGGLLDKHIQEAATILNNTKSKILGLSPADAAKEKDSFLAPKFNGRRAAPGKPLSKSVPIKVGDTVRVLLEAKKGADVGFKSYRAEHYGDVVYVIGRRGKSYKVTGGRHYPRDRLLKVPKPDQKSQALLQARKPKQTKEQAAQSRKTRADAMKALKAKARVAPRRGARVRKKPKRIGS
jgi:hypothetical protein